MFLSTIKPSIKKMQDCKLFVCKGFKWKVRREYIDCFNKNTIERIVGFDEGVSESRLFKDNDARCLFLERIEGPRNKQIYVKKYKSPKKFPDKIRFLVSKSRALRDWRTVSRIKAKSISTVIPAAVGEKRRFGFLKESFFITLALEDVEPISHLLKNIDKLAVREKKDLITAVALFARKVHAAGIFHRDFHCGNILIRRLSGQPPRLYLVDYHRARLKRSLNTKQRIYDLAQLFDCPSRYLSETDFLRFIRAYSEDFWKNRKSYILRITQRINRNQQH